MPSSPAFFIACGIVCYVGIAFFFLFQLRDRPKYDNGLAEMLAVFWLGFLVGLAVNYVLITLPERCIARIRGVHHHPPHPHHVAQPPAYDPMIYHIDQHGHVVDAKGVLPPMGGHILPVLPPLYDNNEDEEDVW